MAASPAAHQQQQQQPIVHETKGLGRLPPRTEQYSTRSKQYSIRRRACPTVGAWRARTPTHLATDQM